MGQPVLLKGERKLYVQPLEIPLGDPGQPGPTELDGRMDAYANWKEPGKGEEETLHRNQVWTSGTIRQMDPEHPGDRGNPNLEM
jgi:hypothetical protein